MRSRIRIHVYLGSGDFKKNRDTFILFLFIYVDAENIYSFVFLYPYLTDILVVEINKVVRLKIYV
jgi:hypothetical protein